MKKILLTLCSLLILVVIALILFKPPTEPEQTTGLYAAPTVLPITSPQPLPAAPASASLSELVEAAFPEDDPAWAWDKVDMEALQLQLPDNLYWDMAIPTDDELVLEQRQEIRKYWDKQYGKVVASSASELEINNYYDYQQRLSSDYVAFADALLKGYGSQLPARDVQLMTLVKSMHGTRLNEYPPEREQALQRSVQREQERLKWLADKDAYEAQLRQGIN